MDHESIVYGCIKDLPFGNDREMWLRRKHNQRAIKSLPGMDDWPFLSREMFAATGSMPTEASTYQTQVIHFGASYRAIEYEWEQWVAKFEQLLQSMYWVSVAVHLETELSGTHTFTWDSDTSYHQPGSGDIKVRCEWQHEGSLGGARF
ncbi:hypothetical protein [Aestuariirhabdus sp. LZHN29]|uniref:hypothetical protein n=1 Tax=Aestuariirhabdus sp. LZHN29 TaxID=3417462 RepID=UPI003CE7B26F